MSRIAKFLYGGIIFLFLSCGAQSSNPDVVSATEFSAMIAKEKSPQILDVRTPSEFGNGHIENALLADIKDQAEFMRRVESIDKDKPVYIYCLSGPRSTAAAKWMRENGYKKVVELQGGLKTWVQSNLPLVGQTSSVPQTSLEEYKKMISPKGITLVDFAASWCPPCVKMKPYFVEIEKKYAKKIHLVKVDAATQLDLVKSMQIDALPGLFIYKNGIEVWKHSGFASQEEIESALKKFM